MRHEVRHSEVIRFVRSDTNPSEFIESISKNRQNKEGNGATEKSKVQTQVVDQLEDWNNEDPN